MTTVLSPSVLTDDEARRRVANALDTTFLVEAGAGTGKTSVLLQRLLALVRAGRCVLERVAAITFTEKAAAELRVRLRLEIDTALLTASAETERHNLREARGQLERAQIATVHAFCAALLRERPVEARVDPAFSVLDQFGADLLQRETWDEWLAQEMDRGPTILKHALRTGLTLAHLEALRDFVVAQRDCLPLLPAPAASLLPDFRATLQQSLTQLLTLKGSCVSNSDRALLQINALAALLPATADDSSWDRLLLSDLPLSKKAGAKANWQPATALEEARALCGRIGDAQTQARAVRSHNLLTGLARWLEDYLRAYAAKKRERSCLDFTDLLLVTRDLLRRDRETRRFFQQRLHFLLVDEFQDTDPLQAEIIFFLAEREPRADDWATVVLQPGKLFLVGDPQQSIYRFRRADLDVYAQARTAIARQGEVLSLSTNFRTRAPALDWINQTFTRAFASKETDQPPYRPLAAARSEETGREVIVLPVSGTSAQSSREEVRQAEARTVAAFITQAVADPSVVGWEARAPRYRDIAILFRTYQAMEAYEEALQHAGVPYRVLGGRRYASRPEVEEMRVLLRAVASPSDAAAVVATLRSSLFGFTDEELALFVSAGGRFDYTALPLPPALPVGELFSAAFVLLRELHTRRVQVSPAALLYEVYASTHLIPLFALRPQGVQRVANLLKLIDTARALSAQGLQTLTALNRFLVYQEGAAEEAESPVTEEHEEALRLLTIHKAKGLEFPVVIVADASAPRSRSQRTGIIERVGGGLELRVGARDAAWATRGWQEAEAREQGRDIAEERRLWYVAATRARDHLVIPVLPQTKGSAEAEPWKLTEGLLPGSHIPPDGCEPWPEPSRRESKVFVYYPSSPPAHPVPLVPPTGPVFTSIASQPAALRAYQEWEAERRVVLTKGRQGGGVGAVTTLAEAAVPHGRSTAPGQAMSPATHQARLRLGRAVHEVLRGMDDRAAARALSRLWTAAEQEEALQLVRNVLASPLLVRARAATERFTEAPFVLHHQGRLLEGVIDLVFIENGGWVIVDFKTDVVTPGETAARAAGYRPQLCLYAFALEHITGRAVNALIVFFARSQQTVTFPWGESERAVAEAALTRMPSMTGSDS